MGGIRRNLAGFGVIDRDQGTAAEARAAALLGRQPVIDALTQRWDRVPGEPQGLADGPTVPIVYRELTSPEGERDAGGPDAGIASEAQRQQAGPGRSEVPTVRAVPIVADPIAAQTVGERERPGSEPAPRPVVIGRYASLSPDDEGLPLGAYRTALGEVEASPWLAYGTEVAGDDEGLPQLGYATEVAGDDEGLPRLAYGTDAAGDDEGLAPSAYRTGDEGLPLGTYRAGLGDDEGLPRFAYGTDVAGDDEGLPRLAYATDVAGDDEGLPRFAYGTDLDGDEGLPRLAYGTDVPGDDDGLPRLAYGTDVAGDDEGWPRFASRTTEDDQRPHRRDTGDGRPPPGPAGLPHPLQRGQFIASGPDRADDDDDSRDRQLLLDDLPDDDDDDDERAPLTLDEEDLADIVERVQRELARRLDVERERRGVTAWR